MARSAHFVGQDAGRVGHRDAALARRGEIDRVGADAEDARSLRASAAPSISARSAPRLASVAIAADARPQFGAQILSARAGGSDA